GVGGVGGYFGGRLAKAGTEVVFIARGENLRALKRAGLRVDSLDGDFVISPVHATDDPAEAGPADAVLLEVKAWQVPEAAEALKLLMANNTFVVPLQNGVEAPSQLARTLGPEHAFGGLCYLVTMLAGPGHVRHAGMKPHVTFGELDNRRTSRAESLLQAFTDAGVSAEIPPDIHAAMWEKFLFIASLSGVGAITRVPVGVSRGIPGTRKLFEQCIGELSAVARARGIRVKDNAVEATMALIDNLPPEATASMQRDIMAARPSELDSQSGTVVRLGREAGIPTPLNEFIYHSLLPQELAARKQIREGTTS
ncbi:MAG: 2-dehydropantoate 2-reductase, partial [Deltaproteobacteria bacterium]|nr:2-dehydropantoate 2-reductase [Deltaproteobacteria bacterium]